MSTVPSGTRFIGISERVNLTERKSAGLNSETQPYTIDDLVDTIGVGAEGPQGVEGPAGPPGPVGPAGLEWQGAWVSGTSYVANDAVGYGGASYFCILATSGTTTPNLATANWALLASQGAIGPQGAQGPTGPQGAGATQTLQQTVGLGNTVNDGTTTLTVLADSIKTNDFLGGKVEIVSTLGDNPYLKFGLPSSSGKTVTLTSADTQSASRTIKLPDADGTVALTNNITLQQTLTNGNTFSQTVGPTTFTTTLTSSSIKVGASSDSGMTLNTNQIVCEKSGGTELMILQFPPALSGIKQITLPNATGTVALTSDITGAQVTKVVKTTITSAQVLQLFTTPITILDSNNPLTVAYPISIYIKRNNGTPYGLSTNQIQIINDFGTALSVNINSNPLGQPEGFTQAAVSTNQNVSGSGAYKNLLYKLKASSSNPTLGTGDLDVYVTYIEITL